MNNLDINKILFENSDLDTETISNITKKSLHAFEDGELFIEYCESESMVLDDSKIKTASFDTKKGFGLRAISGESIGYAHSTEINKRAILNASKTLRRLNQTKNQKIQPSPKKTNLHIYGENNPIDNKSTKQKVELLSSIDKYARKFDSRVKQVQASLSGQWQLVKIVRSNGDSFSDIRPLVRLSITVTVAKQGRMESGTFGIGGRDVYESLLKPEKWKRTVKEALKQALVNLAAGPAPAGEMSVVLGPGWPGILLHEAIGHGLEGDFNRKKTSAFSGRMGEQIASKGVTVLDDGTLKDRRGSLSIDDEGTPSQKTVLIENGILKNYMQDRMNAKLMSMKPTGNGRRQSFAHEPMPRMTNTFMLAGNHEAGEIIETVKDGLYAVNFGGGSVDITSGKFVFSASEAYIIKNGKIGQSVKGATLIGNGPDILTKVRMVGKDMMLDEGIGTCGKDGQLVPVGVGQPTMLVEGLTVGGTEG